MSDQPESPARRKFVSNVALGVGAIALSPALGTGSVAAASEPHAIEESSVETPLGAPGLPARVLIDHDGSGLTETRRQGTRYTSAQGAVELLAGAGGLVVSVTAPSAQLNRVVLRWPTTYAQTALYLGDAWERGSRAESTWPARETVCAWIAGMP
ncbi:MAG: hypothetical protein ABIP93_19260 [Gemmatimonadaceae bacterium]